MGNSKFRFILASASPRRKELVSHLKLPFEIITFNVPEESKALRPQDFCLEIAQLKGQAVLDDFKRKQNQVPLFIVSADTIVCLDGKIFGKPRDRSEAKDFLLELSERTHSVFTAVSVLVWQNNKDSNFSFVDESKVTFNNIDEVLLNNYLDTGDSLDKAGAYGIQGPSLTFISKVEGSYSNVVGFPLSRFVEETKKFFDNEVQWARYF